MNDILYRAAAYLLIIALGVFLKKVGFFHEQDFRTLAKICRISRCLVQLSIHFQK